MDTMSLTMILAIVSIGLFLIVLVGVGVYVISATKRPPKGLNVPKEELANRIEDAFWAVGKVIKISEPFKAEFAGQRVRVVLLLEISPPQGSKYRTRTTWVVEEKMLPQLQPGAPVNIKVDRYDEQIIYPNISGADYAIGGR